MSTRPRSHRVKTSLGVALLVGLIALLSLAAPAAVEASVLVPLSPEQLQQAASTIVAGQVVGMTSRFADGRAQGVGQGYIETVVELEVAERAQGSTADAGRDYDRRRSRGHR